MDDDGADPFEAPPEPPARPGRRTWSTTQIVLVTLAGVLLVGGLGVIAFILMLAAAMNSYASNK